MLATLILSALAALAAAQEPPDAPRAQPPEPPMTLERAITRVGKVTLPSFADWQREKQKELLQGGPAGRKSQPAPGRLDFGSSNDPERRSMSTPRYLTEQLDVDLIHPAPRLTAGVGYADHDVVIMGDRVSRDARRYGFLKLELGRARRPAPPVLGLPTAAYTETEVSPKPRVSQKEIDKDLIVRRLRGQPSRPEQ